MAKSKIMDCLLKDNQFSPFRVSNLTNWFKVFADVSCYLRIFLLRNGHARRRMLVARGRIIGQGKNGAVYEYNNNYHNLLRDWVELCLYRH